MVKIFTALLCLISVLSITVAQAFHNSSQLEPNQFINGSVLDYESRSENVWFLKLYLPKCGHCIKIAEEWEVFADSIHNSDM